jgi:hypothetical protein
MNLSGFNTGMVAVRSGLGLGLGSSVTVYEGSGSIVCATEVRS